MRSAKIQSVESRRLFGLLPAAGDASKGRHRSWAYATAAWSTLYGLFGVSWIFHEAWFPFGTNDREAYDMGSLLWNASPEPTGAAFAIAGLFGAVVAVMMTRAGGPPIWRRLLVGVASAYILALAFFLPDVRILQNMAYVMLFQFGHVRWIVIDQLVCVFGAFLWARTVLAYTRQPARSATTAEPQTDSWLVRHGRLFTYIAMFAPIPYAIVRAAWGFGIPMGLSYAPGFDATPLHARVGEVFLASLAVGGSVLTWGLIRPWGERFPRWMPVMGGKNVPVMVAVVPATIVSMAILVAVRSLYGGAIVELLGAERPPLVGTPDMSGWGASGPGIFWPAWGLGLALATASYYVRRRTSISASAPGSAPGLAPGSAARF